MEDVGGSLGAEADWYCVMNDGMETLRLNLRAARTMPSRRRLREANEL